jgi:hypothetical protein
MAEEVERRAKFLGSLKDALRAASRDDDDRAQEITTKLIGRPATALALAGSTPREAPPMNDKSPQTPPSAAEAVREARAGAPLLPAGDRHVEMDPPTTRVVRGAAVREAAPAAEAAGTDAPARTQFVRGRQKVERETFHQDPVVGWLVVVGGPGLGSYRPIYEGNNTLGRSPSQRIPIDFGDDAISSEEQAYIRYDSADRTFLFVPNLAKTNVVAVNDKKPTSAVPLAAMDVIGVGRTQLVFVPFCGPDFDWSELSDGKVAKRTARQL